MIWLKNEEYYAVQLIPLKQAISSSGTHKSNNVYCENVDKNILYVITIDPDLNRKNTEYKYDSLSIKIQL